MKMTCVGFEPTTSESASQPLYHLNIGVIHSIEHANASHFLSPKSFPLIFRTLPHLKYFSIFLFQVTECQPNIFFVDNAQFVDPESWQFFFDLVCESHTVLTLAMRTFSASNPAPCDAAIDLLNHGKTRRLALGMAFIFSVHLNSISNMNLKSLNSIPNLNLNLISSPSQWSKSLF